MSNKTVKIVLNAMVKNEAAVIERMLESVVKHIDYWVIQDNGSTDGTQDIIKNFFVAMRLARLFPRVNKLSHRGKPYLL